MQLSKENIDRLAGGAVAVPTAALLQLPEKVLQFGTGVLLRGLPDYYIDRANKKGRFNGRIVVVKSTASGDTDAYTQQDCLYTQCLKGVSSGKLTEEYIINASISRVLTAAAGWGEVLACAEDPAIEIIISNTTEAGLVLHPGDSITSEPPVSFPGKLLAFLYRRYQFFGGSADKGMVILPSELLSGNGDVLKAIVLQLAEQNALEQEFIHWLRTENHFCNTLVDRIVPGRLSALQQEKVEAALGYTDELMIMSEPYGLWAIETSSEKVKQKLSFADESAGCIIAGDIHTYRELKLRLLNATHTFTAARALQCGFDTVKEAMENEAFNDMIERLMKEEIAPAVQDEAISMDAALRFAESVLDRFRNPYIEHHWTSITLNYTQKMQLRCIPLITAYYNRFQQLPGIMTELFGAYLAYMAACRQDGNSWYAVVNGRSVTVQDEAAARLQESWKLSSTPQQFAGKVLADAGLWGHDLQVLPGFAESAAAQTEAAMNRNSNGVYKNEQAAVQGII